MTTAAVAHHFATIDPYTGEVKQEFDALDPSGIDRAVAVADEAFAAWRSRPVAERAETVRRAGELMAERRSRLARLVTLEMGKLIGESEQEVELSSRILVYYGEQGPGFVAQRPLATDAGQTVLVNEPLGVLLGIEPWNYPLYQVVRFAAPNLVVGNTMLLKHAGNCPQTALALGDSFLTQAFRRGSTQRLRGDTGPASDRRNPSSTVSHSPAATARERPSPSSPEPTSRRASSSWPRRASARAVSVPIPDEAPVTIAGGHTGRRQRGLPPRKSAHQTACSGVV